MKASEKQAQKNKNGEDGAEEEDEEGDDTRLKIPLAQAQVDEAAEFAELVMVSCICCEQTKPLYTACYYYAGSKSTLVLPAPGCLKAQHYLKHQKTACSGY